MICPHQAPSDATWKQADMKSPRVTNHGIHPHYRAFLKSIKAIPPLSMDAKHMINSILKASNKGGRKLLNIIKKKQNNTWLYFLFSAHLF